MKMERTKKIAALALTGIMAVQVGTYAEKTNFEREEEIVATQVIQPRYSALVMCDNKLNINSNIANCYGYTSVRSGYKAKVIVTLQKKGLTWSDVKTWTKTGTSTVATVDEDYAVVSGTYRVKVTHQALSGSTVVEEDISYSTEVTK